MCQQQQKSIMNELKIRQAEKLTISTVSSAQHTILSISIDICMHMSADQPSHLSVCAIHGYV